MLGQSAELFGPPACAALGLNHPEEVLTQTRVALRALEAYDLLREGHSQPAELQLRWAKDLPPQLGANQPNLGLEAAQLLGFLQESGRVQAGQELSLDVMETALLSALTPRGVVLAARQLVAADLAQWDYRVTVRFRPRRRTQLERVWVSLRTLLAQWEDQVDGPDLSSVDAEAVQADLISRNKQARFDQALRGLRVLRLAHVRKNGPRWVIAPLESASSLPLEDWTAISAERIAELRAVWAELEQRRDVAERADKTNKKSAKDITLSFNMAELEALLPPLSAAQTADAGAQAGAQVTAGAEAEALAYALPLGPLESLLALERLGMIDVARGDEAAAHIFHLERGQRRRYNNKAAFGPLASHYADRTRRIHIMRLLLLQPDEAARKQFVEDYFQLPLDEFCERYAEGDPEELTVAQLPGTRERILGGLNHAQRRVVTDSESRALLVLAGPGSGKTRTIVHRAAALLALENVPPEQILILAYNRTAVAEVRARLSALLGPLGLASRAVVLTFHGLARRLTGLRATDAPAEITRGKKGQDNANAWLLDQLLAHLQEEDVAYRYVLVDEYQDIDVQKYEIVRLLTRFVPPEAQAEAGAEAESGGSEDGEQQSYLVAVGDDDQNIYGFQGADIRYIQQFRKDYQIGPDAELCLTDNYRASPELVAFSNAFITSALGVDKRLKGPEQAIVSRVTEAGKVGFCRYVRGYDAAYTVARKVQMLVAEGTPLHEIAVLAPRWDDLEATEHALGFLGLATQRFSNKDEVRPAQGLLGRSVIRKLEDVPATLCPAPAEALRDLCAPYSTNDAAFEPLRAALLDLGEATYEVMAMRLRGAKALARDAVALSTFHSAKGSEFQQVFVLDSHHDYRSFKPVDRADATRALYVALTRAKRGLFVLSSQQQGHPIFTGEWLACHLGLERVPEASQPRQWPAALNYTLELEPRDLFLSANPVISQSGRKSVEAYARNWGDLWLEGQRRVLSSYGPVAVLSQEGQKKVACIAKRGGRVLAVEAARIIYCERDEKWYAGYSGSEQGHFLVLPRLKVQVPLPK